MPSKHKRAHRGRHAPEARSRRVIKRLAIALDCLLRLRLGLTTQRPDYSHELPIRPARAMFLLAALAEERYEVLEQEDEQYAGESGVQPATFPTTGADDTATQ